jgi:hypothetical protein
MSRGTQTKKGVTYYHENQDEYDPRSDALYRWYLRATIAGAFGAIAAIIFLIYQTVSLRRQIEIQAAGARQWVDITGWRTSLAIAEPRVLEIACAISNPTSTPIVLLMAAITANDGVTSVGSFPPNTLLRPGHPLPHETYIDLTQKQLTQYSGAVLTFHIKGIVLYIDGLKDRWEQRFELTLVCSPTGVNTREYHHTLHEVKLIYDPNAPRPFWRRVVDWWVNQIEEMKARDSES